MIAKRPKKLESEAERDARLAAAAADAEAASEFMVLMETEGRCQVGSSRADGRTHCRRLDTVLPAVYVPNGTREGKLTALGRTCMRHLPEIIALVKTQAPGGNGADFKEPKLPGA